MHALIDFLCACSVFGPFQNTADPFSVFWIYNFCAFALQLPFGIVLDYWTGQAKKADQPALAVLLAGAVITVLGCFSGPVLIGIGNALFHVGGGVLAIREDDACAWKGAGLGVFVAPGAVGLFLGRYASAFALYAVAGAALLLVLLTIILIRSGSGGDTVHHPAVLPEGSGPWRILVLCFAVVILRSAVGLSVSFSWKTGFWISLAAVIALAAGKSAGGFLAARYSVKTTVLISLLLSAAAYALKEVPVFGILALFCFNMTMPITLYQLYRRFPGMPGFAFGALTFALFLGYAAVTMYRSPIPYFGTAASLLSIVLLWPAVRDHG